MPRMMRTPFLIAFLLAALLIPGALTAQAQEARLPDSRAQIQLSFAPVVRATAPAVVSIYATTLERRSPFASDPFFSQLFPGFETMPRARNALGSGVLLQDGLVVTNFHVVRDATDIRVVLADRREFTGKAVLADEDADLAVIRLIGVEMDELPSVPVGNSDALEVGDLVLAIGNPFGVGQTVSSGIVSGLARTGSGGSALPDDSYFIQTDAPINPGNSGGALVNMRGELVGINTLIVTRSGGSVGLGFSIPSNLVAQVVAQARAGNSRFERPWAGIDVQEVDADLAEALGLERPRGVLVRGLLPTSPFAEAGVQPGDVIVSLGGQPVNAAAELEFRMATQPMGSEVALTYLRRGNEQRASVEMRPKPAQAPPGANPDALLKITAPGPFQNRTLAPLTRNLALRLGLDPAIRGVVVVEAPTRISRTGLVVGDVILAVDGRAVTTPEEVRQLAANHSGWWRIDLIRDNRRITFRTNR